MKLVELKNVGTARISVRQVRGLVFNPGESKKVPPATAAHPAVKRFIGRGLALVEASKEEPKAPAQTAPEKTPEKKPETKSDADETTEPKTESDEKKDDDGEKTSGNSLREEYLSAPGVTEDNVDGLLEKYPTKKKLSKAIKGDLGDLGVSKSYAKRLIGWANE